MSSMPAGRHVLHEDAEAHRAEVAQRCAGAAALWAMAVGALVLLGWALDIGILRSAVPGAVAMKPITALSFTLAGAALWMSRHEHASAFARRFAIACAAAVTLAGLLTLLEYLFGWQLNIDQLLFREAPSDSGPFAPGRMAPTTAVSFLLFGCSLLLDRAQSSKLRRVLVSALVYAVLGVPLIALVGYLYGIDSLYQVTYFIPMAVHTAATFLLLAAGLLCTRPDQGLVAIAMSATTGGVVLRRFLPAALFAPILLGWILLGAHRSGLFGPRIAVAFLALSSSSVIGLVVWWGARSLHGMDRLSALVDSITDEVWFTDTHKRFTLANPSVLREFRLAAGRPIDAETLARNLDVLRPDGSPRPVEEAPPLLALAGEVVRDQEEIVRTPWSGELRYRLVSAAPVRDAAPGTVLRLWPRWPPRGRTSC